MTNAIRFEHDDDGYLVWVKTNPDGYVLNVRVQADPNYVVLHRANCRSISDENLTPGAYTARHYRKVCALSVSDLNEAARKEGRRDGSFSKRCGLCNP